MYRSFALTVLVVIATSFPAMAQDGAPGQTEREQMMAQFARLNAIPDTKGTGPFAAMKEEDRGLPDHVVYRPMNLSAAGEGRLGVVGWGNGGCSKDGASQRQYALEVASHGYVVVAPGRILSGPGTPPPVPPPPPSPGPMKLVAATTAQQVMAGIEWVLAENARQGSPYYRRIDSTKIAVAGFSCGGLQALQLAGDARVKAVIIHNSGIFANNTSPMEGMTADKTLLTKLHTPVIYIQGGPKDIAYNNGMDDYRRISHVPAMIINDDSGHGGAFNEPNGGTAAKVAVNWLAWQLNSDPEAAKYFVGSDCGLCTDKRWTVERKNFPDAVK